MQIVSLGDLRLAIKARAELPTLTSTTFITDAEMGKWITQSARKLVALLVSAYGEGHFETTQTLTVTAGQDYTEIPTTVASTLADIYRITRLRVTLDGERVRLALADGDEIDTEGENTEQGWSVGRRPKWRFREFLDKQRFVWSRTPLTAHVVTVHYVPYAVFVDTPATATVTNELANDTNDFMWSHMGWDDWVVLSCAIKAMKRQGLPAQEWQALEMEKIDLEKEIRAAAPRRNNEHKAVTKRFYGDRARPHGRDW